MKYTVCFLIGLFLTLTLHAENEKDFVALLMSELTNGVETTNSEEYQCVTVSPSMMEKMLEMMQSKENTDDNQIKNILPHIKSMRIFTATKHIAKYHDETLKLLGKESKSYKPFKANNKNSQKPCVWIRKNGKEVVEMIVLDIKESQSFHIINLTGNMSKAFVDELLKI